MPLTATSLIPRLPVRERLMEKAEDQRAGDNHLFVMKAPKEKLHSDYLTKMGKLMETKGYITVLQIYIMLKRTTD